MRKPENNLMLAIESKETANRWIRKAIQESNPAHDETAKRHLEESKAYCLEVTQSPAASKYEFDKASDILDEIEGVWK
jgi:hypothetical protein